MILGTSQNTPKALNPLSIPLPALHRVHTKGVMQPHATLRKVLSLEGSLTVFVVSKEEQHHALDYSNQFSQESCCVFTWDFCIEKWRGFLVNFFWSPFPTKRSTPNMTARRFHRTMEMIPRPPPGSLKALLFPPPIKHKVQDKGTQGVRARYGAELPPFI